jgi:putative endonuclease
VTVDRQVLGHGGEDLAAAYLQAVGYRILNRNYRTRLGEIDIVARDGDTLVFVEVKVRRSPNFGSAKAAVTAAKRRRLSMLALQYLKSPDGRRFSRARFDVVAVDRQNAEPRLELVQNAFELAYP